MTRKNRSFKTLTPPASNLVRTGTRRFDVLVSVLCRPTRIRVATTAAVTGWYVPGTWYIVVDVR